MSEKKLGATEISKQEVGIQRRNSRSKSDRSLVLSFIYVAVRGSLFGIEDLTKLGMDRVYAWKTVNRLVKRGVLQKFDRKSYGMTEEARKWFRTAIGGGITDAEFAYSIMLVETWDEKRLDHFKLRLSSMWEDRPERAKEGRIGIIVNGNEEVSTIAGLLNEKMNEVNFLISMLEKKRTEMILNASSKVA